MLWAIAILTEETERFDTWEARRETCKEHSQVKLRRNKFSENERYKQVYLAKERLLAEFTDHCRCEKPQPLTPAEELEMDWMHLTLSDEEDAPGGCIHYFISLRGQRIQEEDIEVAEVVEEM